MNMSITIRLVENGFILDYDDPEIRERNRKSDHWEDPQRSVVFSDIDSVSKTLAKVVPMMRTAVEEERDEDTDFATAFKEAIYKKG